MFTDGKNPDWKLLMLIYQKGGRVSKELLVKLVKMTTDIFKKEENIVKVPDPVIFVGDIHG